MRNFWVLFAKSDDEVAASREFMSVYLACAAQTDDDPHTRTSIAWPAMGEGGARVWLVGLCLVV